MLPAALFDARADADALHKAMKGMGTDEKALINILCHRSNDQRVSITQAYKSGYGKVEIIKTFILNKSIMFIFTITRRIWSRN